MEPHPVAAGRPAAVRQRLLPRIRGGPRGSFARRAGRARVQSARGHRLPRRGGGDPHSGRPGDRRQTALVSDELPRVGGLPERDKYERLTARVPGIWWSDAGPFVGLHQLNVLRVDYFRRVFGGFQGKRCLDVGCGGGILAEALARGGATVTGVDPSEKSLTAARDHAAGAGLAIDYRTGTAETLATSGIGEPFDLV